jgi:hypothetical protein
MNRSAFWTTWLLVACFTMMAFGVLMALFGGTRLFAGLNQQVNLAFWPAGAADPGQLRFQNWVYGVWGATVAGFGLLAALTAGKGFARRQKWARNALAVALALWYLLDTAISLLSQVWVNAALNTAVLALFVVPLAATWTQFRDER